MDLNFVLMEMTHMRNWVPLIEEGVNRGLESSFYIGPSHKYNCPIRNQEQLFEVIEKYDVQFKPLSEIERAKGLLFSSEKTGIDFVRLAKNAKKIVTTYQTDFSLAYEKYVMIADHILMPSEFCANFYQKKTYKNLYLGIPKYDVILHSEQIREKYNLTDKNKKCLIIWPKLRDQNAVDMDKILTSINSMGYELLVKSRGKDPLSESEKNHIINSGNHYFEDDSWFPHTTQELLTISDFAVNFGSTTIEECVMHNVPVVNFDVKPEFRHGRRMPYRVTHSYLYEYDYCVQMEKDFSKDDMHTAVERLTTENLQKEFQEARINHLYDHKNSCKKILDMLL